MNGYLAFLFYTLLVPLLLVWADDEVRSPQAEKIHQAYSICKPEFLTEDEPFLISSTDPKEKGMANKEWENFRSFSDYGHVLSYIPRMSVVRPLNDFETARLMDLKGMDKYPPDSYIPVKVMSLRDPRAFENMKANRRLARRVNPKSPPSSRKPHQKLDSAKVGDVGLIWAKSMRPAKDFNFIVTEDAAFLNLPKRVLNSIKGRTVRLATQDGQYRAKICCLPASPEDCITNYIFQILGDDPVSHEANRMVERELAMAPEQCEPFLNALNPVKKEHTDSVRAMISQLQEKDPHQGIRDLEFFDSLGLVKVPLNYKDRTVIGVPHSGKVTVQFGPGENALHYTLDDKFSGDAFNDPTAVCAFVNVVKQWEKECPYGEPGCMLQWGNGYHHPSWGVHRSHQSKSCFDIRPMRKTNRVGGITMHWPSYDREKTRRLVKLLEKAGGVGILNDGSYSKMFFDDSRIKGTRRVSKADHSDHIHVCFPPDLNLVQNTCKHGAGKKPPSK